MKIRVEIDVEAPEGYTEQELLKDVEYAIMDSGLYTEENDVLNVVSVALADR